MENPKPTRNWRGYFKEYAIIVIGVLTALAAQQAAEWVHWRGEVADARAALHAEMAANNRNLFTRRVAVAGCVNRQISEAASILADLKARRAPGVFTTFRPAMGSLVSSSEWESQRASQVLTHFPHAELALMNRYYALSVAFEPWTQMESSAWLELSILQEPIAGMTASDMIRLQVNLAIAQRMQSIILLNARRQLGLSKQLGVVHAPPDAELVKNFCNMSYDDFIGFLAKRERI